ncbi:AI-2E family transporter [Paracoccus sp. (in: a-proteobacteria)]|uniref:AI-2E family transporter n=1 Tax=Paracoccus sp. TaxID=267 RepID=UPI0026E0CB60|nr:AI-2E family transporter [Paracoccus sp. (in: a-proteobacteria)]MDO5648644.1 AI-2E family transporter [Paracoccus sp. (in: a-proteobacteria)]
MTDTPRRAVSTGTIISALIIVAIVLIAWTWSEVFLLAFASILIAVALRAGAVALKNRLGLNEKIGALLVLLTALGVIYGVIHFAGPAVAGQFRELLAALPESWNRLNDWLSGSSAGEMLQSQVEDQIGSVDFGAGASQVIQRLPDIFGTFGVVVNNIVNSLSKLFLMLIAALYLAMEAPKYRQGLLHLVPLKHRGRGAEIMDELGNNLARWMGGQALDMMAVGILAGIGLWLMGVPLALVLGIIAAMTNIIPIIGPFFSGAIAVLFALTQGFELAMYVAVMFLAIQLFEGEVLMPLIQRYAVSLPPALTVFAIIGFGSMFGFGGIVLATPMLVVLMVLIRRIYIEDALGDRLEPHNK